MPKQYKEFPNTLHLVSTHVNTVQIYSSVIQTRKLALATNLIQISSSSPSGPGANPGLPAAPSCHVSFVSPAGTAPSSCSVMAFMLLKNASQLFSRMCLHGTLLCPQVVHFFFKFIFYFWLPRIFLLHGLFSSCGEQGLLSSCGEWASHCSDFSCLCRMGSRAHRLQELQHSGSVVVAHGHSCWEARGVFPD